MAGVFALVAVVVAVVFVFARNATKPPAPAGAVTVTQPASADSSASGTPTSPPSPTVDPETQAHDALVADRARSLQGLTLDGRWVLQLSSKSDGIVDPQQTAANGSHTFHYTDIQAQFDQLSALARSAGMAPMMLTANDFGTKRTQNGDQLWVLLADPGRLGSQEAAQAACAALFPQVSGAALSNACVPRTLVPLR